MSSKIIFTVLLLLCGCVSNASDVQPNKMVSDFYRLSMSEQMRQFSDHTLDEQYELYIFGNKVVHPPATYLAEPFARRGANVVPFLKAKLKAETEEARIRDITFVFTEMARLRLYDFSRDVELMDLLSGKAHSMQGIWRDITLKFVAEIQRARSE